MEFSNEMGKLQRAMAASSAGISRRQAMMNGLNLASGDSVLDIGCGGGHLLDHLA
ncbi:MAG TPA: SAM-dependent methyltransferase, partial [Hyphomonadaceae bacterium]|nr:SAM-dependent methyltransferase [Hyphomonadaceae bacterium]